MGITEYAEHRGCDLYAVKYAIARGRIALTEDNRIDSDAADAAWADTATPKKPKITRAEQEGKDRKYATEAEPGIPYVDARALREVVEVQRRQLELEARKGILVRKDEVEREAFRLYRRLRDAAMNIPSRLAAQLAAETDEHRVFEILEGEIRSVFLSFAEGRLT
jgi:hypothetical protein